MTTVLTGLMIDHWPAGCGTAVRFGSSGMVIVIGAVILAITSVPDTNVVTVAIPPPEKKPAPASPAAEERRLAKRRAKLEAELEQLHAELEELAAKLSDPALYADFAKVKEALAKLK